MTRPGHKSEGRNEWYTPEEHLSAVRDVLGGIDLDPASSEAAQRRVQALRYFTKDNDGLKQEWHGRVFLNPPYSRREIGQFVSKMVQEWQAGRVSAAVMLTHRFTDTRWFHEAAGACSAICFTTGRVRFIDAEGNLARPTQGQAYFYYGKDRTRFAARFREIGLVLKPADSAELPRPGKSAHSADLPPEVPLAQNSARHVGPG